MGSLGSLRGDPSPTTGADPSEQPRLLNFIPFRRADIVRMCESETSLDESGRERLARARATIEDYFANDLRRVRERLKEAYAPLDPDSDTRTVECAANSGTPTLDLAGEIETVLERANYEKVSEQALQQAFAAQSLFHVRLTVDFQDFEEVVLYYRGARDCEEEVPRWFGLGRRTLRFRVLDRVVLYLRFREDVDVDSTLGGCRPDSTMLKLFQNVPDADIEMLFPNTRVGMRNLDKLMIAVPALVTGGVTIATKVGATLVLLGSLFGFWLGLHSQPVEMDRATVLAVLAGLGTLGGYIWKQISGFRNRKLRYTQALTQNLYFKLLDNNAGVLYRILDDAEESECKESLLAYCFLLKAGEPLHAAELDRRIESWLSDRWQCRLDFEIDDALGKLLELGLAERREDRWSLLDG